MPTPPHPAAAADQLFFSLLLRADSSALSHLLADDFLLIDVMRGGVIDRPSFLAAIQSAAVVFISIEPSERHIRAYPGAAIVTGRTLMHGSFAGAPFSAVSRYTHVFIEHHAQWRLASAQGTPVLDA